jgi:hypothetical protein
MGKSITDQYIPRDKLGPRSKHIIARRSDQIPKPGVVTVVARVSEGHLFLLPQIRILSSKPTSRKSNPHGAPQVSGCAMRGVCPPSFSTLLIPQAKPRPSQHALRRAVGCEQFLRFCRAGRFRFFVWFDVAANNLVPTPIWPNW